MNCERKVGLRRRSNGINRDVEMRSVVTVLTPDQEVVSSNPKTMEPPLLRKLSEVLNP